MTDQKTTQFTELAANPATGDFIPIIDVSDTTMSSNGTNKYIQASRVLFTNGSANSFGTVTGGVLTMTGTNGLNIGASAADFYLSFGSVRGYVGMKNSVNRTIIQGGLGRGVAIAVNNATFASGTVANFDSSGNVQMSGTVQIGVRGENWSNLSFQGTWANYGGSYSTGKYKLFGDEVIFTGMIKGNSGTIATLPAGYRPAGYIRIGGIHTNSGGDGAIEIRTNGDILYLAGGTTFFSLSNISFPTV